MLATGGDVVFYGTMDGWFKAVDARTGTELWKFHVASGIVGQPDHLSRARRQAVRRGLLGHRRMDGRGRLPGRSRPTIPYAALGVVGAMKDIKKYTAAGDTVYVFGL